MVEDRSGQEVSTIKVKLVVSGHVTAQKIMDKYRRLFPDIDGKMAKTMTKPINNIDPCFIK